MSANLRKIFVEHGVVTRIALRMNVSRNTVRSSLLGKTATKKALSIRKMALENGGIEYVKIIQSGSPNAQVWREWMPVPVLMPAYEKRSALPGVLITSNEGW